MSNGGIIGPPNVPTKQLASGVWTLGEQYLARVADIWPGLKVAGYAAGGSNGSNVDTVDKFAFTDDSRSTLATGLSSARTEVAGFASFVAGYVAGGFETATVDTVDKFAFSDDSRTTLATGLSSARSLTAGFASDVAGYVAGGNGPAATVDKFAFTDDSRTTLGTGLSSARNNAAGFAG